MVRLRAAKIEGIQPAGHDLLMTGPEEGDLLMVGWGGTFGAIKAATLRLREQGAAVSAVHLRYLNPISEKLGPLMKKFRRVLAPELNLGQLRMLLRAKYLIDVQALNKVRGQPFTIAEIVRAARAILDESAPTNGKPRFETDRQVHV